jgi:MFS family permease
MRVRSVHYAWVVMVVTFLGLLASAGVQTAPSITLKSLEAEFMWTRSETSLAVGISLFIFGFGAPLGGTLMDKFGPRRVMLTGLAVIALGLVLVLQITQLWQLYTFWGVLVGIGTGSIAGTLGATIATCWFNQHRGIVLGVFAAASAAGQFIFVPILLNVVAVHGWRAVFSILIGMLATAWVLAFIFMRSRPEDIGLTACGEMSAADALADKRFTPLREAVRTRDFWLLALSFFICGYTTNGMIGTHLLPHALEHGFVEVEMAGAISVMGLMNIIGSLVSGTLTQRYDNRKLLAIYYGFRAISLAALPFILEMQGMFLFTIIYGFDWVATLPPTVNLTAQRFGRRSLGTIYGWIFCSHMIGAGIASFAGGFFRDQLGDYHIVFISAAIVGIVASGLTLGMSQKTQPVRVARAAVGD